MLTYYSIDLVKTTVSKEAITLEEREKLLSFLDKIVFMTNDDIIIPKAIAYDKENDKFILSIPNILLNDALQKVKCPDNNLALEKNDIRSQARSVINPLPKQYIDFFNIALDITFNDHDVQALRTEYIQKIKEKEASPSGCSTCAKNTLRRQYAIKLQELLAKKELV